VAQGAHLPFWQIPELQTLLQAPQLLGSLLRSVQLNPPLHEVVPLGQHWAATHPPEAQTFPQAPQLFGSEEVSVHWLLQTVTGTNGTPGHSWHCPKLQMLVASQTLPHFPQLLRSVFVSTHFPWQISPIQPASMPPWHRPPMQAWPLAQACPQRPQFCGSVSVSVQTPRQSCSFPGQGPESGPPIWHLPPRQV
jgi:hypothetical protein